MTSRAKNLALPPVGSSQVDEGGRVGVQDLRKMKPENQSRPLLRRDRSRREARGRQLETHLLQEDTVLEAFKGMIE